MSFLSRIFKSKAKDWIYTKLDASQTPNSEVSEVVVPDKFYVEIWLRSLRIVDVRRGLNRFYPVVHSYVSIPYRGSSSPAEFNMATRPTKLEELSPKNLDRVVTLNKLMLDKIPYRGGNIDLDIGLYSIKSDDLAGPYLSLLENISSKAGVSLLSQAIQFAEPLKTGINLLTGGNDDSIFEIGLSTTYEGSVFQTGYYVVIRAKKGEIDPSKLKVDPDDNKLTYKGRKVQDFPYFVFEIKTSKQKQDWWTIEEMNKTYKELQAACNKFNIEEIEEAFKVFKRSVFISSDLLNEDKKRIIDLVYKDLVEPISNGAIATAAGKAIPMKSLREYDIYQN